MARKSTGKGKPAPVVYEPPEFAKPEEVDLADPWYYGQTIPHIVKGAGYIKKPRWLIKQQAAQREAEQAAVEQMEQQQNGVCKPSVQETHKPKAERAKKGFLQPQML